MHLIIQEGKILDWVVQQPKQHLTAVLWSWNQRIRSERIGFEAQHPEHFFRREVRLFNHRSFRAPDKQNPAGPASQESYGNNQRSYAGKARLTLRLIRLRFQLLRVADLRRSIVPTRDGQRAPPPPRRNTKPSADCVPSPLIRFRESNAGRFEALGKPRSRGRDDKSRDR